jgi:cell volume regulation protein A
MYPVVADVPGSNAIFNIVFFITLLSLVLQGATIVAAAKKLDLLLPVAAEKQFDVELPEEAGEQSEILITEELIAEKGNTLQALALPRGMLVIFIKRDGHYIVPNGSVELVPGDLLLVIASSEIEER